MLCEKEVCSGCMACYNVCPVNAIELIKDEEGFINHKIDNDKCIRCSLCNKVCPSIHMTKGHKINEVFACWSKDNSIRINSTSGGVFSEFSKKIINEGGMVFGAAFNEKFDVEHIGICNEDNLYKLVGSKYVQSNINYSFRDIKTKLNENIPVLFCGTPCQIAGLRNYLKISYKNLFTCDIICHGVPSPKVFTNYREYMIKRYNSNIKSIKFRYKKPGWNVFSMKIDFENDKSYIKNTYEDPYIRGFLRELFLRPSCHKCLYTNTNRIGDITIADFWGYNSRKGEMKDKDKGVSMVLINTQNGQVLFNKCKSSLIFYKRTLQEAINGNKCLSEPFAEAKNRKEFWEKYNKYGFEYVLNKYMYPDRLTIKDKIINNIVGIQNYRKMKSIIRRNNK